MVDSKELAIRFTFHPVHGDQAQRYEQLRAAAGNFAALIVKLTPESREQSLALTALEGANLWANAAIARREE